MLKEGVVSTNRMINEQNISFICCDYKILLKYMKKQNIKVDCVLADPPYNISRKNNFTTMGRAGINFGKWDYGFNQTLWIKNITPLIRNGGSIIIFNDWKNLSYIVRALETQGFVIKDLLRWEKTNPMPRNVNSRYVTDFELAIWAVKGRTKWTFNKLTDKSYLKPSFKHSIVIGGGG